MLDKITIDDVLKTLEHYVKGGGRYSTAYEKTEPEPQEDPVADSVDRRPSVEDGLFAIASAINNLASVVASRPVYYYQSGGGRSVYGGGGAGGSNGH